MPNVSVIVPVYKAEKDLSRCVDSLLAQTYADFELILVDDGSPDRCPEICEQYRQKDPRVRVIHQKNAGPSAARNRGLSWAYEHSETRFISFVDSDDCVHPRYLECLYEAAVQHHAEISMCRHRYVPLNGQMEKTVLPEDACSSVVSPEDLVVAENGFNYVWGKLYSKKAFDGLRFPEEKSFGEDNLIVYRAMFRCAQIAFLPQELYYYFYNSTGITKSRWMPNSLQVFDGIREQLAFYREHGYERAWRKEMELYVQQYAYQIHRIREDREHLTENRVYLTQLTREMKQLTRQSNAPACRENDYWFEALHPGAARLRHLAKRFGEELRENGLTGVAKAARNRPRR